MTAEGSLLILGDRDQTISDALGDTDDVHAVADLDRCLAEMRSLEALGRPVRLVVVASDVPQPLSAGRRLRSADRSIGLAFVVPPPTVSSTKTRMAFVPELTDVVILASGSPARLGADLLQAAKESTQRARFVRALDRMNQDLQGAAPSGAQPPVRPGVSERYLAALTRHAPDAIIAIDPQGKVVTVNAAAVDILDLGARETEGRTLQELLHVEDPERLRQLTRSVSRGESTDRAWMALRRTDGHRTLLSVTAAPVLDADGEVAGSVFMARDITEQRRTNERLEQLQRAEGLATLAGGVAHDFNNLLVTMQGWARLAAADLSDTDLLAEALDHIQTASERAAELARAMLAYGGRGDLNPGPCDVSSLVDGMRTLFAASVRKKISLEIQLADDLPEVQIDESQLRQVVMNLVTNADEAIGDAPGMIRVRTFRGAHQGNGEEPAGTDVPSGEVVVIEVADSGPGMDEQTAARIFDPFFTTKFTGRGLGLAASLGIARAHGGTLRVDSRPGAGSRFQLILPTI